VAITKNIVSDYGADNTGVDNVLTKFYVDLNSDMQGEDVDLTCPAGTYNWSGFYDSSWINGALSLVVHNAGATWTGGGIFLMTSHMGQVGIDSASGRSARIKTVSAGATSVELTAASASAGHISRFAVGRYIMVAGWDIQGNFQQAYGFPPNFQWVEFVEITDITGNVISFSEPLRYYYDENWPEMHRGTDFEADGGGPGTIFDISAFWDIATTFNDGTYDRNDLINCCARSFTMNGGESIGLPIFPSVNKTWRADGHVSTNALCEVDKLNDLVEFVDGEWSQIHCQSSSTRLLTINGTIVPSINGTVRNAEVDNATIGTIHIGPTAYGRGDTFICRNSTISGDISGGLRGTESWETMITSMDGSGVMTVPISVGSAAGRILVPDASGRNVLFWWGDNGPFAKFKVLSATADRWPADDDQSATTNVTTVNGQKTLEVSSPIFSADDIGKVIKVPGAQSGGQTLYSFITGFTDSTHVTLHDNATASQSAVSQSVQWGTCNMYFQTDWLTGLPSSALYDSGNLNIFAPPARSVRFENCTGTDQAEDLSQLAAWNRPFGSYTKRTYDGSASGPSVLARGHIVSIKVNVTQAYTGVQSTLTAGLGGFFVQTYQTGDSDWSTSYNPRFNLKTTGERVIQIGSTTGTQTGDSGLGLSVETWMNDYQMSVSQDISGEDPSVWPEFTIEIITDQGFPSSGGRLVWSRLR
jgi:hypothetical protein